MNESYYPYILSLEAKSVGDILIKCRHALNWKIDVALGRNQVLCMYRYFYFVKNAICTPGLPSDSVMTEKFKTFLVFMRKSNKLISRSRIL